MQSPWVNDAEFIGYFAALDNGWYRDAGLDLAYQPGGPDIIAEAALLSNRADIALAPLETVANLIARDKAPLRIVGAQYQKSPLGVVSLAGSNIKGPRDLVGKTLAVPAANVLTVDALFRLNGINKSDVKIVPYQYDPTPLVNRQVDATIDFVTNVPFAIKQAGAEPSSFLIYDFGFKVFNDVVVVTDATLKTKRNDIVAYLRASRRGWIENFKDVEKYPRRLQESYFKGTGRTVENEIFFNRAQQPLIDASNGIFSITSEGIDSNLAALRTVGIQVSGEMFYTDLLKEV